MGLLRFLAEAAPEDDAYGAALREEAQRISARDPAVLFHDDLAAVNEPFSITDFTTAAGEHGLQFLGEANYHEMQDGGLAPQVAGALAELAGNDVVRHEQLRDFVKGRRFRQTLLCRSGVALARPAEAGAVRGLLVASPARPVEGEARPDPGAPATFRGLLPDATLTTDLPLAKAALLCVGREWPRAVPFERLAQEARALLEVGAQTRGAGAGAAEDGAETALAEILLAAYAAGLVTLRTHQPALAQRPGERPEASALARWQSARGGHITTLLHTTVRVEDETARTLFRLLDGTRDREALVTALAAEMERKDGERPERGALREALEANLERLAAMGLLTG